METERCFLLLYRPTGEHCVFEIDYVCSGLFCCQYRDIFTVYLLLLFDTLVFVIIFLIMAFWDLLFWFIRSFSCLLGVFQPYCPSTPVLFSFLHTVLICLILTNKRNVGHIIKLHSLTVDYLTQRLIRDFSLSS